MKYLAFVAVADVADKIVPAVYIKDTEDEALAIFHRNLANYLVNQKECNAILCMVIREDGFVIANQRYVFVKNVTSEVTE